MWLLMLGIWSVIVTMNGKFVSHLVMSTCRQSARVSDRMGNLPSKSNDDSLGRAVLPGLEWVSDTGISGSDSAARTYCWYFISDVPGPQVRSHTPLGVLVTSASSSL